jgi:hypothetical protein
MDEEIPKRGRIWTTMIVLLLLLASFYFIASSITKYTGYTVVEKEDASECLKDSSIELYIKSPTPIEDMEKLKAKKYLKNARVSNCLIKGGLCNEKNINSFPTWIINNKKIKGDITPEYLAKTSGCGLENIK